MNHDVYICCDKKEENLGEELYNIFEENNIKPWIKSKNMSSDDSVDKITNAISDSKCFVLLYSKLSKDANYIITEIDIAFSRNIPILIFNIDNSKISRNLQFILENEEMIHLFPNPTKQLEHLVKKTSDIIGKPIDKVKINSKSARAFKNNDPNKMENKIKKIIKIAIPVCIVLILIYLFVIVPSGQKTTSDGIFTMNITDVDVSNTTYTVYGESYNMPNDPGKYFMNIKFFDENDNMVFEVNSTADEFKSGKICSFDVHTNNVTHIGFKLTDMNNNELCKQNYKIK